jgi:capsular polysaccharide biosynthesis protein
MNLLDYLRIVIRRGWIIILAVLITATSAFIYSKLQTPIYRATQQVSVQPARNDFGLAETLRILLQSYVIILNTENNAQAVIDRLELDMLPGELRSNTTINSDPTTLVVRIDVDLENQEQAARIAREWGQLLVEWRDQQNSDLRREDRIEADLLDYPQPGLYRPNTRINVLAAAILGLLIGGLVIFVVEYMESNVLRTPEDVERWIQTPVLASITSETRGN